MTRQIIFNPNMGKLSAAAFALIIIAGFTRYAEKSLGRYIKDNQTHYQARKMLHLAAFIVGLIALTFIFSDKLKGFGVALGVAGAGIAFALQEIISSVAGWAMITFGSFYKTGDRVQLGGIKGDVIDIGVLRTTLMETGEWVKADLYNGRIVLVANSSVFKQPVFNYSGKFPFLWDEIIVPIRFGSDRSLAREIILQAGREISGPLLPSARQRWNEVMREFMVEDARLEPAVTLIANDNWLEFTLRYVVNYKARRSTKDRLFERIVEEIDKTAGKVTMASATFEIVGIPPLQADVRSRKEP
ncbi:MAG: mechanosensitive ion channel [Elusimicrobia bacterium]|nr:mechanosensitive ion channel [Elusimicrobiota bacterium]